MTEPFTPRPVRVLRDLTEIKAVSDPLRIRILEVLQGGKERSWTVKEIAAALGEPPTKLYHHIKQLEQVDLVHDVETRVVSGIVEHRYRVGQLVLRFDDDLFRSSATRDDTTATIASIVDGARDEIVTHLLREGDDSDVGMTKVVSKVPARQAEQLQEELVKVIRRFEAERDAEEGATDEPGLVVLLLAYPEPTPQVAADEG